MWQTFTDFVMTWLDPVSVVIGLVVTLPVFWTWYEVVLGERRRRWRWFRQLRNNPGQRPALLIVDLLPDKNVHAAVELYRRRHPELANIPGDRVVIVRRDKRLTPDDMPPLHKELRKAAAKIVAAGADTVHYFHAGPAIAAALVGAELANTVKVCLYHHEPNNNGYRNYGPLKIEP